MSKQAQPEVSRGLLGPGKHDGKAIERLPILFTYTPVEEEADETGEGFSQAGGHQGTFDASGDELVKEVGERERQFYEAAAEGAWPVAFLPRYRGRRGPGRIGLENLTAGMRCPCVIDLKMGKSTVEAGEKSLAKKAKMKALDMVTGSMFAGVRLEGLSVYRALEQGKVKTSKRQSHAISAAGHINLQDVLTFFLTDESGVRRDIGLRFIGHLERILHHFETQNKYLFIGSSILLIYDNDNAAPHSRWARALERATKLSPDSYAALRRKTRMDVRMIDFAHTGPLPAGQRRDEGYITGLKSILKALQLVRESGATPARPIFSLAAAAADVVEQERANAGAAASMPLPSSAHSGVPAAHHRAHSFHAGAQTSAVHHARYPQVASLPAAPQIVPQPHQALGTSASALGPGPPGLPTFPAVAACTASGPGSAVRPPAGAAQWGRTSSGPAGPSGGGGAVAAAPRFPAVGPGGPAGMPVWNEPTFAALVGMAPSQTPAPGQQGAGAQAPPGRSAGYGAPWGPFPTI